MIRKILSVAEKPSIAKKMSLLLTTQSERGYSHSKYNPVYLFQKDFLGEPADHVVTSVTGHVNNYEFDSRFQRWDSVDPEDLFNAPIFHRPDPKKLNIVKYTTIPSS